MPAPLDVLYLHPTPYGPGANPRRPRFPVLPVGAAGLMNLLCQQGLRVAGLNLPVEEMLEPGFSLDAWLRARPPAALALLDLHWAEHALGACEAARRVRRTWPETRVVAGGLTATLFARQLLEACPAFDAVICGDGEPALPGLVRAVIEGRIWPPPAVPNLWTRAGAPSRQEAASREQLDALDFADLEFLEDAEAYQRLVYSFPPGGQASGARGSWLPNGRGCPLDCSFCGGGRETPRRRAPEALVRDLRQLAHQGVDQACLNLDPDVLGGDHRRAFLERWAAEGPRIGLYLESFQLPSRALADGLARCADAACSELAISPLSGDERIRRRHGKRFSDVQLLLALDLLAERNIPCSIFFSLNLPGEDERSLELTMALAERLAQRPQPLRVANLCHALDPGSPMAREPRRHGIERLCLRSFGDWLARGRRAREGSLRCEREEDWGFVVGGRDLGAMAARWDGLAASSGGRVQVVPGP